MTDNIFKKIPQDVLTRWSVIMSDYNVKWPGHFQNLDRQCPMTDCYFQDCNTKIHVHVVLLTSLFGIIIFILFISLGFPSQEDGEFKSCIHGKCNTILAKLNTSFKQDIMLVQIKFYLD